MHLDYITFAYVYLFSHIVVLALFLVHFGGKTPWYVKFYMVGKLLQILSALALGINDSLPYNAGLISCAVCLILSHSLEMFGIISFHGRYNKRIMLAFLSLSITSSLLFILFLHVPAALVIIGYSTPAILQVYGGAILILHRKESRFGYMLGFVYISHALFLIFRLIVILTRIDQYKFPPEASTFESVFLIVLYILVIVSSAGYLIILKEQDENALDALNRKIRDENYDLKKLDEEKNKFFSLIAHDLKAPIGSLAKLTGYLIKRENELNREDFRKWLDAMFQTSSKTYDLLDNLLQWARSQSGRLIPKPKQLKVSKILNDVIDISKIRADEKHITILSNCSEEIEIFADQEMIKTVVRNLLSNAIKFTPENGYIRIECTGGENTQISIQDTGVGMDGKVIAGLFNLDRHYTSPGTARESGTGLGLKICHEFVSKNNGEIRVESKENEGSRFTLFLPGKP